MAWDTKAQGQINFHTSIPTRLWSEEGPIAGASIWGQLLAGPTLVSLVPVGVPVEHWPTGVIIGAGTVEVPTVPCLSFGFAQMVAWDGNLWGSQLEDVPPNQLGATDVVSVFMSCDPYPISGPQFTQGAIVPIPEPSVLALASLGLGTLLLRYWRTNGHGYRRKSFNESGLSAGAGKPDMLMEVRKISADERR